MVAKTFVRKEDVKNAILTILSFKCPKKKRLEEIKDCNGHHCLTKPEPPFNDYYSNCLKFLEALQILRKVQDGEIEVK